jgi:hypothetical protein
MHKSDRAGRERRAVPFFLSTISYHHSTNSEAWVVTDFSVTIVQIKKKLTKKGCTYDSVYNLGAYNYPKIPHFFRRGIKVPLYSHTMSLVEIQLWSYFQNNMVGF